VSGVHYDVVVPTAGRDSLGALLAGLAALDGAPPGRVVLADDRRRGGRSVAAAVPPGLLGRTAIVRSGGRGPAAARNAGWRATNAPWVVFLDDDVLVEPGWGRSLAADLDGLDRDVAGSQGRVRVPLPAGRRPTDWERNVAGLQTGRWITADMALRRSAIVSVEGFDERFPRPYREDADLGLRLAHQRRAIVRGTRTVVHPVPRAGAWVSVRKQAGNRDDALMRRLHGPGWRKEAGAPRGRLGAHTATAAAGAGAAIAIARRHPRAATAAGAAWLAGTAELAWRRIAPGPRDVREVSRMLATSALLPFAATGHRAWGELTVRRRVRRPAHGGSGACPAAVLLDRDGTLVVDVPYNGDPARVVPMPGAREAVARLRAAGIGLGVVSNQSGIGRGLLDPEQVDAVNARIEVLLGPLGPWAICPHGPDERCGCRKPEPGLVHDAAERLGVAPARCAVIGDIGADVEAARAAGARAILVPTTATRLEEIAAAPELAPDLPGAVDLLLGADR
jgi:histidinol-phosphate phosphatase family protein